MPGGERLTGHDGGHREAESEAEPLARLTTEGEEVLREVEARAAELAREVEARAAEVAAAYERAMRSLSEADAEPARLALGGTVAPAAEDMVALLRQIQSRPPAVPRAAPPRRAETAGEARALWTAAPGAQGQRKRETAAQYVLGSVSAAEVPRQLETRIRGWAGQFQEHAAPELGVETVDASAAGVSELLEGFSLIVVSSAVVVRRSTGATGGRLLPVDTADVVVVGAASGSLSLTLELLDGVASVLLSDPVQLVLTIVGLVDLVGLQPRRRRRNAPDAPTDDALARSVITAGMRAVEMAPAGRDVEFQFEGSGVKVRLKSKDSTRATGGQ